MGYEIHVTVSAPSIEQFKSDCLSIGVKPIIIETENNNELDNQVMTSSKYPGDLYRPKLDYLVHELQLMGYDVLRQKVEIQPGDCKHVDHIYYESHLRLKIPSYFDFNPYKAHFIKEGWHLSKNIFKRTEDNFYQMLTYRTNELSYLAFKAKIDSMKSWLDSIYIEYDKIEIEECIFDSNVSIDNKWLAN